MTTYQMLTVRDFAAVTVWEDALAAADRRGAEWMERAELIRMSLEQAVGLAGRDQITTLVGPLAELLAEAEALLADRKATFDAWAAVA